MCRVMMGEMEWILVQGVLGVRCAGGDARGDGVDIGAGWGTRVGEGNLGVQFSPIE